MTKTKFDTASVDVSVSGVIRNCKLIIDSETKLPWFPASVWLLNENGRKQSDYTNTANRIKNFLNFCFDKNVDPLKISNVEFQGWLEKHLWAGGVENGGRSASTVQQYAHSISVFLKGMVRLGFMEVAPEIPAKFFDEKLQHSTEMNVGRQNSLDPFDLSSKYLSPEDFTALCSYLDKTVKKARLRKRDELILKLGYQVGLRASEVVNPQNFLKEKFINATKQAREQGKDYFPWKITGKGKGIGKTRIVDMPTTLAFEITKYLSDFEHPTASLVFSTSTGNVLSKKHPSKVFAQCRDALLVHHTDQSNSSWRLWHQHKTTRTFHCLRHTFATNLVHKLKRVAGSNEEINLEFIREKMGHSDSKTTLIYVAFESELYGNTEDQEHLRNLLQKMEVSNLIEDLEDD